MREDFRNQLDHFFDMLEQALDTGDSGWLDPLLENWATSLTETDLEGKHSNLLALLREIETISTQTAREMLTSEQALELVCSLIPHFSYCYEKAAFAEMNVRVSHVTTQLEETRQSLERLDRSKSDFIAVAAHELKTPLTLVEGYAAMLKDVSSSRSLTPYESSLLDGISTGTRRLKGIIDDMIDVSLLDNNLLSLNFQPVWINRLLNVIQHEVQPHIQDRKQNLVINRFPGDDLLTFGDPERLLQVIRNVITNAVKYTPDGGTITIDGRQLPGFTEIIVSDTGIGIAAEDQVLIFDKFARLGNSDLHSSSKTKFKGGGPGLGLHIARGIVESHGGAIWVESPGFDEKDCPGSTFHILIPARSEPPDEKLARLLAPLTQAH
ncbi:MAG: HAMP domain-containing histidine kinase [Anaerolineae bacterium]|nr:HAMP domain-containing histidine kinase [Anaerolineae bacterium]